MHYRLQFCLRTYVCLSVRCVEFMQEVSRLQVNTQAQVDDLARKMETDKQTWMRAQKDGSDPRLHPILS